MEAKCNTESSTDCKLEVSKWFKDEEFYWRSLASYIWLALIYPLIFTLFVFCVNASILSPLAWVIGTCSLVLSLSSIATIVVLQLVCLLTTIPHSRALAVQKVHHSSKLNLLLFLLRPRRLFNLMCFVGASSLMASTLITFSSTLPDNAVFLSLLGPFLGLFYTVTYYKGHGYVTEFPVIQQPRFFRLKKSINLCVRDSLMLSLKALQIYYPLYILTGLLPSSILPNVIAANSATFLVKLSTICDVWLFLVCFCISMAVLLTLHLSNLLLKIFNTKVYTFPVIAGLPEQNKKTLADAMESNNTFLKHLAFLDFNILSRYQGERRLKIFDLSPPGNQPHAWQRTSTECLKIIEDMQSRLNNEHERKQQLQLGSAVKSPLPAAATLSTQTLFSPQVNKDEQVASAVGNKSWIPSPSKLFSNSKSPEKTVSTPKVHNTPKDLLIKTVVQAVVKKPVDVFEHLQITLWCIEGLCNLVAVSLKEDRYGAVQQKLPAIMQSLLLTLECCEVFVKSSFNVPSANHSQHVKTAQVNNTHATSLKIALKTGLYTITTAFGYHISAIRLPGDHKKRLHAFLEFAE